MNACELHLRTAQCIADLANKVTLLVWENLPGERGASRHDPHRFPGLAHALSRVLESRIGPCQICSDPRSCDVWARTGGGPPTAQKSPPCQEHERRLLAELGPEIADLLAEVEKATVEFFSRHNPDRAKFQPSMDERVHHAVIGAVAPYLYGNIACSCCEGVIYPRPP